MVRSDDQTLLVARDAEGDYEGVVCPPGYDEILESFISPTNPALVRLWRTYRDSKGASTFFWDVLGIAAGLRDLGTVPGVRRLLNFASAGDLFHNSWQARLMRVAAANGRQVAILPAAPDRRQPDFQVHPGVPVEIKAVISDTGVEMSHEGTRLSPPDVRRITRSIEKKCQDALGQVGASGVVVVALWCDLAANAIDGLGEARPISAIDFVPGTFVLALSPSVGPEPHTAVVLPAGEADRFAQALGVRLMEYSRRVSLPLTGRLVAVSKRPGWTSIGRVIAIANWAEQYAPYEVPGTDGSPVTDDVRASLAAHFRDADQLMAAWRALVAQSPLESRVYSALEVNTDPRFDGLFCWGSALLNGLLFLRERQSLFQGTLPEGRPRTDAIRFIEATVHPGDRLDAAGLLKLDRAPERMARLTSHLANQFTTHGRGVLRP